MSREEYDRDAGQNAANTGRLVLYGICSKSSAMSIRVSVGLSFCPSAHQTVTNPYIHPSIHLELWSFVCSVIKDNNFGRVPFL